MLQAIGLGLLILLGLAAVGGCLAILHHDDTLREDDDDAA